MNYTNETFYFDYGHSEIQIIIEDFKHMSSTQEIIHKLYIRIRDEWRYTPFNIGLTRGHFIASNIAKKPEGHCIDKAILLVACLRALNIPARLHLAKVSNHIATERLEKIIGTNELAPHGMVDVFFDNQWVKCSPAFNKELCDLYQVDVLDFDGTEDAVLQQYNKHGNKFMAYLEDYGHFEDVPFTFIKDTFKSNYPDFYEKFKDQDQIVI